MNYRRPHYYAQFFLDQTNTLSRFCHFCSLPARRGGSDDDDDNEPLNMVAWMKIAKRRTVWRRRWWWIFFLSPLCSIVSIVPLSQCVFDAVSSGSVSVECTQTSRRQRQFEVKHFFLIYSSNRLFNHWYNELMLNLFNMFFFCLNFCHILAPYCYGVFCIVLMPLMLFHIETAWKMENRNVISASHRCNEWYIARNRLQFLDCRRRYSVHFRLSGDNYVSVSIIIFLGALLFHLRVDAFVGRCQ